MLSKIRSSLISYILTITTTPLQFGVWIMAVWFTSNGPAGYLTCTTMFSDPMAACTTEVAGFIPVTVSVCHLACHAVTALIGLVAVFRFEWAKAYALIGGIFYIAWAVLGLAGGEEMRGHLGVDVVGSWTHVVEGSILLLIWLALRKAAALTPVTFATNDASLTAKSH